MNLESPAASAVPLTELPIDASLPALIESLRNSPSVVLRAPTGAGKTSRVPPTLLAAGLAGAKQVLVLQPRRLAARAAAGRIAEERGWTLGQEVGYQVRFERKASGKTRILVVTEGIFIRMLQDDPFLDGLGVIVFDEFHERNLNTDLALAMVRKVQTEARPDLKIVVMSATLATQPVAHYLGDCPIIESQGRLYPVEVQYLKQPLSGPIERAVADGVSDVLERTRGDVLAFLPGVAEIRRTAAALENMACQRNLTLMELYGDLPLEKQQAVLVPAERRKIVLSTNVAETSVTIEGITAVVDSGLARSLRLDPALGLNRLELGRISRASADQRTGRAGRTSPGVCLRLWTEWEQRGLAVEDTPEIHRVDLAGPVLELLCWGEADVAAFPWFDPPPATSVEHALQLLRRLDAVNGSGVTELGRTMARLPVHPRIARLLVEGQRYGEGNRAALVAALLSDRDPFLRSDARIAEHWSDSDVLDRLAALEAFERSGVRHSSAGSLDTGAAKSVLRARDQLRRLLQQETFGAAALSARRATADEAMLRSLLAAYPDRVARRREADSRRGLLVGGRGVRLADRSPVMKPELFVCVDLEEVGKSEALVRQASAVERDWLAEARLRVSIDVEFDPRTERVTAVRRTRYDDLILEEAVTKLPPGFDPSAILVKEALARLDRTSWFQEAELKFLTRVRCLREWMPQANLPDWDDPLRELLPQLCVGCLSLADLRKSPVLAALKSLFTYEQLQAIEREAPDRWQAPSGSFLPLEYTIGQSPTVAVRIQELFGLEQTPRIAGGRVPVVLHLLAPNMRPQQVTDDLESFWRNTYPLVRKELKRRYPKHAWPEDPWTAAPERRPGRKR